MNSALLIGYVAREIWSHPGAMKIPDGLSSWTEENRKRYLLRSDVERPCSVDMDIWPSVFDLSEVAGARQYEPYDSIQDISSDLESLLLSIRIMSSSIGKTSIVAISVCSNMSEWTGRCTAPAPSSIQNNWVFLGYDVADMWLMSSLCGGLYSDDLKIMDKIRSQYIKSINAHHLFNDFDTALDFERLSNDVRPEHRPFSVFGVWIITTINDK